MAAKKKGNAAKSTAKEQKKAKAVQKVEKKEKKKDVKLKTKSGGREEDDQDLEAILDNVSPSPTYDHTASFCSQGFQNSISSLSFLHWFLFLFLLRIAGIG